MEDCDYYWIGLVVVFVTVCVGLLYDKLEQSCEFGNKKNDQAFFDLEFLDCKRDRDEFSSTEDLEFQESFQDSNSTERNEASSFSSSSRDEFLA